MALAACAITSELSGRIVLMSISSTPSLALRSTPSSPSTTDSTCGWSGSMVITTSASATASATFVAAFPPAAASVASDSGTTS
ncbi:hypothetical protein H4W33_001506 [Kibdelosporangium phytohabitans]|nr:hypothetical protein [Kibdelosporangium phytohabitans]